MKVLIITRRFYPHGDATSVVVRNLADALIKKESSVLIVGISSYEEDQKVVSLENIEIINLYRNDTKTLQELINESHKISINFLNDFYKFVVNQLKKRLLPVYSKLSLNPSLVNIYKEFFDNENNFKDFDAIIITMMPHEAVYAALLNSIRKPIIIYQLDTFSNNKSYPFRNTKQRMAFEKNVIEKSSLIVTTPIIYDKYIGEYPDFRHKIISAEFPMIKKQCCASKNKNDDKCHFVFLGTLYPKIRPVDGVIHFISLIRNNDYFFDFYGNKQILIRKSPDYSKAKDKVILHGIVPLDEAEKIRNDADFLINIDNTNLTQVPSKIFEYFSTGKPIINFYFSENSPAIEYFKKYPKCININLSNYIEEEVPMIIDKIELLRNENELSYEEVENIFKECTPEYVADVFLNAIDKINLQ